MEDNTGLAVKAQGFWWSDRQCAYFDVRMFNPQVPTNCTQTIAASYLHQERGWIEEHTISKLSKESMDHLHQLSCLPQKGWVHEQRCFTRGLHHWLLQSMQSPTVLHNVNDVMQNCLLPDWLNSDVLEGIPILLPQANEGTTPDQHPLLSTRVDFELIT